MLLEWLKMAYLIIFLNDVNKFGSVIISLYLCSVGDSILCI